VTLLTNPCVPGRAAATTALVTKKALLRSRLPEPDQPELTMDKTKVSAEYETNAYRVQLTTLENWTKSPDETGSLLDAIRQHMENSDSSQLRCGPITMAVTVNSVWVRAGQGHRQAQGRPRAGRPHRSPLTGSK
jgi:hypothetical protein